MLIDVSLDRDGLHHRLIELQRNSASPIALVGVRTFATYEDAELHRLYVIGQLTNSHIRGRWYYRDVSLSASLTPHEPPHLLETVVLTIDQVAQRLRLSKQAVRRLKLPTVSFGRGLQRYFEGDVVQYEAKFIMAAGLKDDR